ncbi:hypothetical protein BJ085DRAFT_29801 [Dimargaris cristalligena]|uniref:MIT domain-containing protein n=1 Tax=Dimargaris cristalligena TaxID=215637 RepID=A0A4P9ZYN7_9FUNG|nr:hypothetical protein BJ085DRAFT_29801 [Dimargaris cristalligena]|eukprot:RKP38854.1 hypothetical protein BJ085DRAFT_29801 [Dimargaris cristalligena]
MVFFTPVSYLVDMTHRVFPLSEAVTSRLPFVSTFITTTTTTSSSSSSPALPARPSEAPKPLFVPGKVEAAVTVALEAVHKDSEGARDVALQLYLVALESLAQAIQPGQQDILPATHLARGISALQPSPSSTPVYASAGSNRRGPWQRRVADSPEPAVSPAPNDPTPAALAFVGGLFYHLLTLPTTLGQRWLLSSSTATSTSTTTIPTPLTTCPPRATWIDITGEQESVSAGSLSSEEESTAVDCHHPQTLPHPDPGGRPDSVYAPSHPDRGPACGVSAAPLGMDQNGVGAAAGMGTPLSSASATGSVRDRADDGRGESGDCLSGDAALLHRQAPAYSVLA